MSNIISVPLNKLTRSARNVRKSGGESIDDLASSILVHGLIHNLTRSASLVADLRAQGWAREEVHLEHDYWEALQKPRCETIRRLSYIMKNDIEFR